MVSKQLSVIVPAYNAGDIIEHCLMEICHQKKDIPGPVEVIVVDDASQDNTGLLAKRYCDRLIVMKENSGAARARNRGVKEAEADIVVFVDADVIISEGVLRYFWQFFKENNEISAVVGTYTSKPFFTNFFSLYHNAFTCYHHDFCVAEIDWFWGALSAIRKEVFNDVGGFNDQYKGASAEDLEFGYDLVRKGYTIRYRPEARGMHAHFFSFRGMFANDFKKAILGIKLKVSGKFPDHAPRFASYSNCLTPFLLLALLVFFIMGISNADCFLYSGLCLLACVFLNMSFYRFLKQQFSLSEMIPVIGLHWFQVLVICAGAVTGIAGVVLGKQRFGEPGWM